MDIVEAKAKYSDLYRLKFEDDTEVVFRLLSFKEYEHFNSLYLQGLIDSKDESIFDRCVINLAIPKVPGEELRAGVKHTVINVILQMSGPNTLEDWQFQIENSRSELQHIITQVEMIICKAFPAYKPEDIWNMSWQTMMHRFAQAEAMLLQTGVLKEQIQILDKKKDKVSEFVKDATKMKNFERSTPIGVQHPVGRESNWDKVDKVQTTPHIKRQRRKR